MSAIEISRKGYLNEITSVPMRRVVILRGVSGAGKSSWAEVLYNAHEEAAPGGSFLLSADNYFVDSSGKYRFNP